MYVFHRNGSYTWTQQVYAITDNSYDSLVPAVIMNYTFQLQICKNIETQTLPKKCNVTGAIYAVSGNNSFRVNCTFCIFIDIGLCTTNILLNIKINHTFS